MADNLVLTVLPRVMYVVNPALNPQHQPIEPYDTSATAATNLFDVLDFGKDDSVVKVLRGVYEITNELQITKGIRFESVDGPEETVLNRNSAKRSVKIERAVSLSHAQGVLAGFTVENGYLGKAAENGAGILLESGIVTNCIIRNSLINADQNVYGAGVMITGGLLVDSVISNNLLQVDDQTYRHAGGAGVCLRSGRMHRCRIVGNQSEIRNDVKGRQQSGSGVLMCDGEMTGCLIAENTSPDFPAAGLAVDLMRADGTPIVSNCTVTANKAAFGVGGVLSNIEKNTDILLSFVNCLFIGNEGASDAACDISLTKEDNCSFVYCFGKADELPEGEGNIFGSDAVFKMKGVDPYCPQASSPLARAGVYGEWMAGTVDLRGKPRASSSGKVTIGCYQVEATGLMIILR